MRSNCLALTADVLMYVAVTDAPHTDGVAFHTFLSETRPRGAIVVTPRSKKINFVFANIRYTDYFRILFPSLPRFLP